MNTSISTNRFTLRLLNDLDASERYLSWFEDKMSKQYIAYSSSSIRSLKDYINSKNTATDCILWGIFFKGEHIGNIKYEPIDLQSGQATMGILIGEPTWRGKGVAAEVIAATANCLKKQFSIGEIILGVDANNIPAIKSYEKLGFRTFDNKGQGIYMRWSLS